MDNPVGLAWTFHLMAQNRDWEARVLEENVLRYLRGDRRYAGAAALRIIRMAGCPPAPQPDRHDWRNRRPRR